MRTTVNIDDDLLRRAREEALRSRRSLGDIVDDALRVLLARTPEPPGPALELPVYGGSGFQPGVDLEDRDALAALLDDSSPGDAPR